MTTPINLNKARKARVRAEKRVRADANAAKFGRSKAERVRDEREAEGERARLDAHRRKRDDER